MISITLPGTLGSFEILNHHAPVISTLDDGKLIVRGGNKTEDVYLVHGGVVEASNNKVIVLAVGITHRLKKIMLLKAFPSFGKAFLFR